jgi:hypothetical protein
MLRINRDEILCHLKPGLDSFHSFGHGGGVKMEIPGTDIIKTKTEIDMANLGSVKMKIKI